MQVFPKATVLPTSPRCNATLSAAGENKRLKEDLHAQELSLYTVLPVLTKT